MNQWYYGSQGQQNGPLSEVNMRNLIAQGVVTQETLVWREGMIEWRRLAEVTELMGQPMMQSMPYQQNTIPYVPNSGLAIASMVCGIASIIFCYIHGLPALAAVICGHMALKRIRESEWPIAGRGMAIAGLILGYLGILIQLAEISIFSYVFFQASHSSSFP